ncbi:ABC transporter permease [Thiospirochaeta perfilievii]|uniref:ABC transporter permease n=1 Tax=Thiospirochaeta perfilievii TaxID=252967 RepID=UPI001659E169|nr:iron ABC transporter permease [Thiospirochaeta perfilievii]
MFKIKGSKILILLPLLFLITIFYLPLLKVLIQGLNFEFFKDIYNSFYYKKIISFTVYQGLLSALLSVLIGIPGAYLLTRYNFIGKRVFLSLSTLPFILPSILTVLGFVLLFGNSGYLNNLLMSLFELKSPPLKILYSIKAVLLAHIFYNTPLAIRIISSRWKKIPYEVIEASYSLGLGKIKTFFKVTIPYLTSSILTSFTLIFLYCFMSFGIILVLGGGPNLSTIEVEVYRFARISLNIPKAASLSIIESLFTLLILFLYLKSESREPKFIDGSNLVKKISIKTGLLFSTYIIPLTLILVAPLVAIVISSFLRKEGFTGGVYFSLHWYKSIFGSLTNSFNMTSIEAIKNSLLLGLSTLLMTIPMALLVTFNINKNFKLKSIYTILFFLPMGISSIIIGLSYLNLNLPGSFIFIVFAHTFISLPISIRSINNIYKTIDISLIEASESLGYRRFKTFLKVELPLIKGGIITAGVFSFSLSVGEMNASIMLAPSGFVTLPLAIYQLIGSYNFYGACALGSILLLLSFLSFRLMDSVDI